MDITVLVFTAGRASIKSSTSSRRFSNGLPLRKESMQKLAPLSMQDVCEPISRLMLITMKKLVH